MSSEHLRFQEEGRRQEDLVITPATLLEDNKSLLAERRRSEFETARIRGELIGVDRCSDARVSISGNSISVGTISAAESPRLNLAKDRGIQAWMSLSHFDGNTVEAGKMPVGCGGLAAKEQIGDAHHENGVENYVSEKIAHKDAIIQAIITAEEIASIGGKPVLAAAQDHLSHEVYPLAYFQMNDGEMTTVSAVRNRDILRYNPERIYENGIPTISESSLPDVFQRLLENNRRDIQETFGRYPNLRNMQKVQRPRMVMLSTDIRSAKIKYPTLSSVPGSIFKVFVPREKIDGGILIKEDELINSLNQLEYPIKHAAQNHNNPNLPFSNTDRLIIETGSIDISRRLAEKTLENQWMKDWLSLPDRKIIIVQTVAGTVSAIDEFDR